MKWDALSVFFAMACIVWFFWGVSRLAPWWREDVGRTIMWLSGTLFVAALPQALHYAIGVTLSQAWFSWFYRAVWIAIGMIHLWRWWVYRRIQREARVHEQASDGGDS